MSLVDMSEYRYLLLLRVLGAWWSLGSSSLEPHVLLQHMADPLVEFNEGERADPADMEWWPRLAERSRGGGYR